MFLEGVENATVRDCAFSDLDGNALFLSGYTRGVTLAGNEFAFIGDNAMAAWGYTRDLASRANDRDALPFGVGVDGTGGTQPRGTEVVGNVVREIGLNERQSSAWGEFKAGLSHVHGNLFFNMPRAAVNFNARRILPVAVFIFWRTHFTNLKIAGRVRRRDGRRAERDF